MPWRTSKRPTLAHLLAVVVPIACSLVLLLQMPSAAASQYNYDDIKRSGLVDVVDEDEDEEEKEEGWDFMDDDAILGLDERHSDTIGANAMKTDAMCVDSLPYDRVNDDYSDCIDGSDEPNTSACSYVLLSSEKAPANDGVCDCCDGSDENEGVCGDTCQKEWQMRLKTLDERMEAVQKGYKYRKLYLQDAMDKVEQLTDDHKRLVDAYQTGKYAYEDTQRRAQHDPELRQELEHSFNVLRRVQYITYVQSRVVDPGTFLTADWKPAFVKLVGRCFSYTVDEKALKGGTPNVIPRTYEVVLCPFQNISQAEASYVQWMKEERQTKGVAAAVDESEKEEEEGNPRPIILGIWNEWQDTVGFTRVQSYNHGEHCSNGQEHQTRVELSCGATIVWCLWRSVICASTRFALRPQLLVGSSKKMHCWKKLIYSNDAREINDVRTKLLQR
uniref:Glucosidase II beta subunit N-terminal domain-containing protein n=1 Tax=Hyaloperonospora arabidopsidis (strain Emoy2) TaxID=559515 RepID=M4BTF6_HYAAE